MFVVSGPGNGALDGGIDQVTFADGGVAYRLPDGGITTSLVEPICRVEPSSTPLGTKVYFDGSGSQGSPGATVQGWAWNFGDGTLGQGATPTHIYTDAGTFTALLTATDDSIPPASGTTSCPSVTITP